MGGREVTDSCCFIAETNTTVSSKYPPVKNFKSSTNKEFRIGKLKTNKQTKKQNWRVQIMNFGYDFVKKNTHTWNVCSWSPYSKKV